MREGGREQHESLLLKNMNQYLEKMPNNMR
jgi:hypothetical protein